MAKGSDWIKKKVTDTVNAYVKQLMSLQQPPPKSAGLVKITNSDKTKGQTPDGTQVDITVVGSPGTYANARQIGPNKYAAMRSPLSIMSTDGGQKAYIMGQASGVGGQTWYIKDISTSDDLENPNKGQWLIPVDAISYTMDAIPTVPIGTNIGDRQGARTGGIAVGMSKTLKDLMFCQFVVDNLITSKSGVTITLVQSRMIVKTTILRNCTLNSSTGLVEYQSVENATRTINYPFSTTSLADQPAPTPASTTCFGTTYTFAGWSYGLTVPYTGSSRNFIRVNNGGTTVIMRTDEEGNGHIDMYGSWFSDNTGASILWLNTTSGITSFFNPCPDTIYSYTAITQGLYVIKDVTSGNIQEFNFPTDVEFQSGVGYTLSGVQTTTLTGTAFLNNLNNFFINKTGTGSSLALKTAKVSVPAQRIWLKPEGQSIQSSVDFSSEDNWIADSIRPYSKYSQFDVSGFEVFKVFEDEKFLKVTPVDQDGGTHYQYEFNTLSYNDSTSPTTLNNSVFLGSSNFYPWYAIGSDRTPPSSVQETLYDYTII